MEKYTIALLDTCLPDYFQGFSGHVYAVPVSSEDTYKTVLRELNECISQEEIFGLDECHYEAIEQSASFLFGGVTDKDAIFDPTLEPDSENNMESVYAYFGVRT